MLPLVKINCIPNWTLLPPSLSHWTNNRISSKMWKRDPKLDNTAPCWLCCFSFSPGKKTQQLSSENPQTLHKWQCQLTQAPSPATASCTALCGACWWTQSQNNHPVPISSFFRRRNFPAQFATLAVAVYHPTIPLFCVANSATCSSHCA